jgi:phage major head subunit gpT-like protein
MIINTAGLGALFVRYANNFKGSFNGATPEWPKFATEIPSTTEANLYAFLGQFPRLREWLGDRVIKNVAANNYSLANKNFESTVGVPVPKMEDDTFGVFDSLFQDMGYSAKMHPDEMLCALALLGHTELCYDGQGFVDDDHPIIVAGVASTYDNYDGAGATGLWYLLDTRRPLKPFIYQTRKAYTFVQINQPKDEHVFKRNEYLYGVDARCAVGFGLYQLAFGSLNTLTAAHVDTYMTTMMGQMSDEGKPLGIKPNLILCGPSHRVEARNLVLKEYLAGGESNPNFKEYDLLVSPYLV